MNQDIKVTVGVGDAQVESIVSLDNIDQPYGLIFKTQEDGSIIVEFKDGVNVEYNVERVDLDLNPLVVEEESKPDVQARWEDSLDESEPVECWISDIDEFPNEGNGEGYVHGYVSHSSHPYKTDGFSWKYATPKHLSGSKPVTELESNSVVDEILKEESSEQPWYMNIPEEGIECWVSDNLSGDLEVETVTGFRGEDTGYPFDTSGDYYTYAIPKSQVVLSTGKEGK